MEENHTKKSIHLAAKRMLRLCSEHYQVLQQSGSWEKCHGSLRMLSSKLCIALFCRGELSTQTRFMTGHFLAAICALHG